GPRQVIANDHAKQHIPRVSWDGYASAVQPVAEVGDGVQHSAADEHDCQPSEQQHMFGGHRRRLIVAALVTHPALRSLVARGSQISMCMSSHPAYSNSLVEVRPMGTP